MRSLLSVCDGLVPLEVPPTPQTDNPFVKNEMLELASVCDEVANNIEDHLTDGYCCAATVADDAEPARLSILGVGATGT